RLDDGAADADLQPLPLRGCGRTGEPARGHATPRGGRRVGIGDHVDVGHQKPACSIEDTRPWIIALRLRVLSARKYYAQLTTSIDITAGVTARKRPSTGLVGRAKETRPRLECRACRGERSAACRRRPKPAGTPGDEGAKRVGSGRRASRAHAC